MYPRDSRPHPQACDVPHVGPAWISRPRRLSGIRRPLRAEFTADRRLGGTYPGTVLRRLRDSSGRPALTMRAIAALTLLGLLVLSAPLVLVPFLGWLADLLG